MLLPEFQALWQEEIDINELNIAEKMAAAEHKHPDGNGGYYFYSNMWDITDAEGNLAIGQQNPTTHKATTVMFEPSVNNERYYYAEDTLVYDSKRPDPEKCAHAHILSIMNSEPTFSPERILELLEIAQKNQDYLKSQGLYETIERAIRVVDNEEKRLDIITNARKTAEQFAITKTVEDLNRVFMEK